MQKAIEMLDETKESIINAYEIKTGLPRNRLSKLMDEETWMNANKAVELGFADEIIGDKKTDNSLIFSQKTANGTLFNKVRAKTEAIKPGRSVDELSQRLDLIKKYF